MRILILISLFYSSCFSNKDYLKSISSKEFEPISYDRYIKAVDMFEKLFNNNYNIKSKNLLIEKKDNIISIKEKIPKGVGGFLINIKGKKIILQMPHCKYDKYTCNIGWKLFFEGDFFGVSFSSSHRYLNKHSDLAHSRYNFFTAQAKAFAINYPNGTIIQIHGFNNKKRKKKNRDTQIIVSNGTKTPTKDVIKLNSCFDKIGYNSKLYPTQIDELGATTNSTKKVMHQYNSKKFIHIELDFKTRKSLFKNKIKREEFLKCLDILN